MVPWQVDGRRTRLVNVVRGWLAAGLLLGMLGAAVQAQAFVSIEDLTSNISEYKDEKVQVQGWVASEKKVQSRTFKGYYLKDRYATFLLVRTTEELPPINAELTVTGIAMVTAEGDIYLTEIAREESKEEEYAEFWRLQDEKQQLEQQQSELQAQIDAVRKAAEIQDAATRQQQSALKADLERQREILQQKERELKAKIAEEERRREEMKRRLKEEREAAERNMYILFGVIGVVIVFLMGLVFYAIARKAPKPIDYPTVKFYRSSKPLPGRFILIEGGRETHTVPLSDQTGKGEVEIGRDSGDIKTGIRIKDPSNTMSRRQARLVYTASTGEFRLVNLAGDQANPTLVNNRAVGLNEVVVLQDGDLVQMGRQEMKFRRS